MKTHTFLILLIAFIGNACTSEKKKEINSQSFYTIDFPDILKTQQEVFVSDIAESVEYIRLGTTSSSLLGRIMDAKFTKDYIFIRHNGNGLLAQFDKKGNFIRNVGKIGRGPREYTRMREFSVDEENQLIYIQSNNGKGIMIFSFNGEYIKSLNNIGSDGWICWAHDTLFIQFYEPVLGNEKYVFIEKDPEGDTLQVVNNNNFWDKSKRSYRINGYWGRNVFYRLDNKLHFKGWYNDTIYTYDSWNKITPKNFIDLKQYKLPDELRPERNSSREISQKYYWIGVRESSKYIFVQYSGYSLRIKAKEQGGFMYFDKQLRKGYTLTVNSGRKGFVNDIDGGPNFVPEYTNDSVAFHFISALEFNKYINSADFLKSNPKYPKQKEQLIKQMESLSENDNQVLMIVKLKGV